MRHLTAKPFYNVQQSNKNNKVFNMLLDFYTRAADIHNNYLVDVGLETKKLKRENSVFKLVKVSLA